MCITGRIGGGVRRFSRGRRGAAMWFGDNRKTFVTFPTHSFLFIWRSENTGAPLSGGVA